MFSLPYFVRYFLPSSISGKPLPVRRIEVNSSVVVPGVDWGKASRHIVLAFSLDCQYCVASGAFYNAVSNHIANRPDEQFLVISPYPRADLEDWMQENGIRNVKLIRQDFGQLGIGQTPTIALVNENGLVTDIAIGMLSSEEEEQLFDRLDRKSNIPLEIRVSSSTQVK